MLQSPREKSYQQHIVIPLVPSIDVKNERNSGCITVNEIESFRVLRNRRLIVMFESMRAPRTLHYLSVCVVVCRHRCCRFVNKLFFHAFVRFVSRLSA